MIDTTHIANTAEDLISHKLQNAGLLVAKPKFDRDGTDLLVLISVGNGARFCRIQCKGRTLINSNSATVDVYESYVSKGFVLFLYIYAGNDSISNLYCFFANDIKNRWILTKQGSKIVYRLTVTKSSFDNINKKKNLIEYSFSEQKVEQIKSVIKQSNAKEELKHFSNIITKQKDLISLQNEKSELEKLVMEIKYTEELLNVLKEKVEVQEQFYNFAKSQIDKKK